MEMKSQRYRNLTRASIRPLLALLALFIAALTLVPAAVVESATGLRAAGFFMPGAHFSWRGPSTTTTAQAGQENLAGQEVEKVLRHHEVIRLDPQQALD